MKKPPQFKLKNIKRAQQIISALPEKEDKCTREEAAEQLMEFFKRGFRKGYTPKELSRFLREEGIIMPENLIARYQENDDEPKNLQDSPPRPKIENPKISEPVQADKKEPGTNLKIQTEKFQSSGSEKTIPDLDDLIAPVKKPVIRHGGFEIRPDTPIGEL